MLVFLLGFVTPLIERIWGLMMKVIIDWWRQKWIAHIERAIVSTDFRIMAQMGNVPYLLLTWTFENNSETKVRICRVSGGLYRNNWRISTFDASEFPVKHEQAAYSWSPTVVVQKRVVPSGEKSGIEVQLFPPIEFWLMDNFECSLYNAAVEVQSFWGRAKKPITKDRLLTEGAEELVSIYRTQLRSKLSAVMK